MTSIAKLAVELIGTFVFLSVILSSGGQPLAVGMALATAVFFGGAISGGHFNPAVTIMDLVSKGGANAPEAALYILVQIIGGIFALYFFKMTH